MEDEKRDGRQKEGLKIRKGVEDEKRDENEEKNRNAKEQRKRVKLREGRVSYAG